MLDQEPWDIETSLVPLPWRKVQPTKDITVGIMWDDGIVAPLPPIVRGLQYAKEKLVAAGIKVVDWEPYNHADGWSIVSALYFPDAAHSAREMLALSGEPAHHLTEWAFTYGPQTPLTIPDNWSLNARREQYRADYHRIMKERGVDFILSPTYVGVAAIEGEPHYWNYTAIWNVLDQPSTIFPTGLFQDPSIDKAPSSFKPRDATEAREWKKYEKPELYKGAPINLQLTGKHFKDEETVAASKLIAGLFGK